jgi:hypothetical protein
MILTKKLAILVPTVAFGNTPLEVSASIDTNDPKDLESIGMAGVKDAHVIGVALFSFVEQELFASKEAIEQHAAKDFNLQLDFSKENARNDSMKPRSRY